MKKETKGQSNFGITLIALVITIIVLLILAGVTIALTLGENGLLNRTQVAKDESIKEEATEIMNLKITGIQLESYGENKELATLQYLADKLCEDEDMEYVIKKQKEEASLNKIDVANVKSIFAKMKKYPYEFEIDSSLKLASIDGIKIADIQQPSSDSEKIEELSKTILQLQSEIENLQKRDEELEQKNATLEATINNINNKIESSGTVVSANTNYSTTEQVVGSWTDGKPLYQKTIFYTGTINADGHVNVPSTVQDIDNIVLIKGTSYRTAGDGNSTFYCNISEAHSSSQMVNVYYEKSQNVFGIHCVQKYVNTTYQITFQYTKTTD